MVAASVLVTTVDPAAVLPAFVRSVDAQTLPAAEFELVVVDASSDGSFGRLQQLAERRPNVTVLRADAEATEPDRIGVALERATGEYVVVVGQEQQLAPRALEVLLEIARRTEADVVLGRVAGAAASGSAVLAEDADRLDPSEIDPTGCLAMVRKSVPAGHAHAGAALLDLPAFTGAAATVSAVGRYACASTEAASPPSSLDVSVAPPEYRWRDGMLHIAAEVRLLESPSPALRMWLVVARGQAEIALPATIEPGERDGMTTRVSAVLDPMTAEAGHPLEDGPWGLLLRLAGPRGEVTAPLPAGPTRSAVVAGRPYVVGARAGAAYLDAGAVQTSVVGAVPKSQAAVVESEHGSLLTLDYPALHTHGDAVLDGRLLLGTFGLPARLICHGGRARFEAYVGALAGVSNLAVVVGGGEPVPTGFRLRVGGTGEMTLEDPPVAKAPPRAAPSAAAAPLVQRLRRRVPDAMDPLVRRLARVPILRGTYRRLLNR